MNPVTRAWQQWLTYCRYADRRRTAAIERQRFKLWAKYIIL